MLVPSSTGDTRKANDALLKLLPCVLALWWFEDGNESVQFGLKVLRSGTLRAVSHIVTTGRAGNREPGVGLRTGILRPAASAGGIIVVDSRTA